MVKLVVIDYQSGNLRSVAKALESHPLFSGEDLKALGEGHPQSSIEARLSGIEVTLPLQLKDGQTVGMVAQAHEQDASLTPDVLLENLAC